MRPQDFIFPEADIDCSAVVFGELHKIDKILPLVRKLDTVIQAGGNVGVFPDRLQRDFKEVVTFEPDAENFACLKKNVPDVLASFGGLSDSAGCGHMVGERRNCGALQIEPGGQVPLFTIDSLDIDCDLIYLDVEGYEYRALMGAKETIARCHPVIVAENKGLMLEFPSNLDGSEDFRAWVTSLGYHYHSRLMRDDVFV